jgi:hypothetical protein
MQIMLNSKQQVVKLVWSVLQRASSKELIDEGVLIRRVKALCRQRFSGPLPSDDHLRELIISVRQAIQEKTTELKRGDEQ